jgi:hypothetical protein
MRLSLRGRKHSNSSLLFPAATTTLLALTSVRVQCFASSPVAATGFIARTKVASLYRQPSFLLRGGAAPLGGFTRLFSTTEKAPATTTDSTMMATEKLQALRARMKELDLDVYLVPSDDPHLSGKFAAAPSYSRPTCLQRPVFSSPSHGSLSRTRLSYQNTHRKLTSVGPF